MSLNILKIISILCLVFCFRSNHCAQILRVNPQQHQEYIFTSLAHFNPLFIKRNKLKEVKVSVAIKPDMEAIKQTKLFHEYIFNEDGVLDQQIETYYKTKKDVDSIITKYIYDNSGSIVQEIRKDKQGHYTYSFKLKNNRPVELSYTRRKMLDDSLGAYKDVVIFKESYEWDTIPLNGGMEIVKYVINDIGKKYKKEFWKYDSTSALISRGFHLIMNGQGEEISYTYDLYGRVSSQEIVELPKRKRISSTQFVYDEEGNLLYENTTENGEQVKKKEYLYDEGMMIKTQLVRDDETATFHIYKASYTFYK